MANPSEDFINKFHSLEGTTIAQKRKNFFVLLHQNKLFKDNAQMLDFISLNLQPRTYLEHLFKLDFLIYFRRKQELYNVLKEGNDVFVSKITKERWFFQDYFNEVDAEDLVNNMLPSMSFSVRMKVLRKLSRFADCQKFDEIFDAVTTRYGIFIALKFITGCSPGKIRQILLERSLKLTSVQLKILYSKDPDLIDFYFSFNSTYSLDRTFMKFLFVENRPLYDYLQKKYQFRQKLGRRATKKFVAVHKDDIIKYPINYYHDHDYSLDMKAVIRKIGKDSLKLLVNALPTKLDLSKIEWLLRDFPKKYHYSLYFTAIQNHYSIQFLDCPYLINERLLNLIRDNRERAIYAKVKVDQGADSYLKYLETHDSIPLIKEKINLTSDISERGKLIQELTESCSLNNDAKALHEVMKYFNFRHKNDDLSVHLQFINHIERLFGFKEFTEEMWACLNDLLAIHMLKSDMKNAANYQKIQTLPLVKFSLGTSNYQKLSYLNFLFNKNEPIDELILEYFTTTKEFPSWGRYSKEFEKYILVFAIRNTTESVDKDVLDEHCSLMRYIVTWNSYYKDDQLSFYDFPVLVHAFNYLIRHPPSYCPNIVVRPFRNKIFTTEQNECRDEYLSLYWNHFTIFGSLKDILWFLKYDPCTVVKYIEPFFKIEREAGLKHQQKVWYIVRKLNHLKLDETLTLNAVSTLSDENSLKNKPQFVTCLSMLMKPQDFAAFADLYKPASKRLDLTNEKEVRLYNLQCSIAQNFKNTKSYVVFPSVLNYCAGDYFKYSLTSLYSLLYRTPEDMLPEYLSHLSRKAVSVRKHALYLTCELSTVSKVENIIKILNKQEAVQSLQKLMFATTIKYFVKNPSDQFFELVKLNMMFVSKADDESLRVIARETLPKIPLNYKARYVKYSWEFLEKTVDIWENKLENLKYNLLTAMNTTVCQELPLEFGLKIIREHFMTKKKLNHIHNFMFDFLLSKDEKSVIFETIFNIVDQLDHDNVIAFFHNWYDKTMSSKGINLSYLIPCVNYFEKKITMMQDFRDYVKLFFLKMKLEFTESTSSEAVAEQIFFLLHDLVTKCGPHILRLLSPEIKRALNYFIDYNLTVHQYCYSLIKNHPVPDVAVFIMDVMGEPRSSPAEIEIYRKTLEQIKSIPDLGVSIIFYSKFKSLFKVYFKDTSTMEVD